MRDWNVPKRLKKRTKRTDWEELTIDGGEGGGGGRDERASDRPGATGGANPSSTTFSSRCQCAPQDQHLAMPDTHLTAQVSSCRRCGLLGVGFWWAWAAQSDRGAHNRTPDDTPKSCSASV
ncbi:hypothetical protein LIA77_01324 [Sarocladium implicatum]|nr:hypothetical protein LIA77_01324 [Sarocladium implicatum]